MLHPSTFPSRRVTRLFFTLLPFAAAACHSPTTTPPTSAASADVHAPRAQAPVKLVDGLGPVHHRVSTVSPEAQKFFDQGLAYMYAFNHNEADRSFARAAELDPKLAMAHWGRASRWGPTTTSPRSTPSPPSPRTMRPSAQVALLPTPTPPKQAYIDAVAKRYPADPKGDWRQHAIDYKNAMSDAHPPLSRTTSTPPRSTPRAR